MRTARLLPALLLLGAALLGPASGGEESAAPYLPFLPGAEPLDADGAKTVESIFVAEAVRPGVVRPIAGARVRCFTEDVRPVSVASRLVSEGATDEFGIANVPKGAEPAEHWLVDAKGFGVAHEYGSFGWFGREEFLLERVGDRRFRVLDPFGEPLAGARVEVMLGCPHSPPARTATTDDAGGAVLPDVSDEGWPLWILAPGVSPGPYELPPTPADGSAPSVLTRYGATARGTVTDEDGKPLPGVVVREIDYPRGPVAVTDGAGRFVLEGLDGSEPIGFFAPDEPFGERPDSVVRGFAEDVPLGVVLRKDRPTTLSDGEPRHRVDLFAFSMEQVKKDGVMTDWRRPVAAPIRLVRLADGLTFRTVAQPDDLPLEVPPGEYRVTAGGGLSDFAPVTVAARLPLPGGRPLEVELAARQPWFRLGGKHGFPATRGRLRIPGESRGLSLRQVYLHLPADVRAAFVVEEPRTMVFPVGPTRGENREAKLVLPEPSVVRFRVRDAAGEPLAALVTAWTDLEGTIDTAKKGEVRIVTRSSGWVDLEVGAEHHVARTVELVLPDGPAEVDLGEVVLEPDSEGPTGPLRVVTAAGEPVEGAYFVTEDDGDIGGETDEEGYAEVDLPATPVEAELVAEGYLPLPVTLSRDGPDLFRLPGGSLTVHVRDAAGKPLAAVLGLGGRFTDAEGGGFVFRGLAAGPHTLLVGARGRVGEVRRLVLEENEAREIEVTLPAR